MSAVIEKKQMKNGVLILTMNRPQVLNAMNKDLIVGLLDTFKEIEKEKESRVVVLTGKAGLIEYQACFHALHTYFMVDPPLGSKESLPS